MDFENGQVDEIHFKNCYFEQVDLTDAAPKNTTLSSGISDQKISGQIASDL